MASRDRRERREQSDSFHNDRMGDLATLAGFIGFAAGMYALGRASSPGEKCCDELVRQDLQIIKLQGMLPPTPLP